MSFRFIHSSDLHLGKRFGQFGGDLPAKLREARHAAIGRLAEQARTHGATTILLAGDTFDTETPARDVRRQALAAMRDHAPLTWVILPGNHDSLQAAQLWADLRAEAPDNVVLALEPAVMELAPGVALLPAACTTRRPGRDLTEWMDGGATADGTIRIGLAHGAVQSFSEEGRSPDIIAPDRARRAGLAYLALGDWHGGVEIDPRTRYSGTPEPDRFKHDRPGEVSLVVLEAASALPQVTTVPIGSYSWRTVDLNLLDSEDPRERLERLLPDGPSRRQWLVRLVATGHVGLTSRSALAAAVDHASADFASLEFDDAALVTACEVSDLDAIDRAGALREAAEALLAEATDAARSAEDRDIASAALSRLHAYAQAATS